VNSCNSIPSIEAVSSPSSIHFDERFSSTNSRNLADTTLRGPIPIMSVGKPTQSRMTVKSPRHPRSRPGTDLRRVGKGQGRPVRFLALEPKAGPGRALLRTLRKHSVRLFQGSGETLPQNGRRDGFQRPSQAQGNPSWRSISFTAHLAQVAGNSV
jgi:hypothetical protein